MENEDVVEEHDQEELYEEEEYQEEWEEENEKEDVNEKIQMTGMKRPPNIDHKQYWKNFFEWCKVNGFKMEDKNFSIINKVSESENAKELQVESVDEIESDASSITENAEDEFDQVKFNEDVDSISVSSSEKSFTCNDKSDNELVDEESDDQEDFYERKLVHDALQGDSSQAKSNRIVFEEDEDENSISIGKIYDAVTMEKSSMPVRRGDHVSRPLKRVKMDNIPEVAPSKDDDSNLIIEESNDGEDEDIDEDWSAYEIADNDRILRLFDEDAAALEAEELATMSKALKDPDSCKAKVHIKFEEEDETVIPRLLSDIEKIPEYIPPAPAPEPDFPVFGVSTHLPPVDSDLKPIISTSNVLDSGINTRSGNGKVSKRTKNLMKAIHKYWFQRYRLFTRFDHGILMDPIGWYSATPERIAKHTAQRMKCEVIIDAFCGVGGNTIQFAMECKRVIAIDINPCRLAIAKHNAQIYGVDDRIEFILGDFVSLASELKGDAVFLGPPWGGPSYNETEIFNLHSLAIDGFKLFELASLISKNVAYCLPRNVDSSQVISLAGNGKCEIEKNMINGKVKFVTAYYGDLIINS